MTASKMDWLGVLGLQARLALARIGPMTGIALLSCVLGAGGWLWLVPHLRAQSENQRHELAHVQQSFKLTEGAVLIAQPSVTEVRMENFYDALGEKRYAEQQIKTLFAVAAKTGLNLDRAEYKSLFDKNSNTSTYQITLPVKGAYPAIRQFCEQTLLAIPFASLDEMNFKRDAIANRTLEAKLRFTLYFSDAVPGTQKMNGVAP